MRFFREFFGYPNATKVFKDSERVAGIYQNPDRGTAGSPGFVIDEADRVVEHIVRKDRNVFESLLTTDEFFVYHNKDNETGRKVITEWREVWEKLKDTPWKTDPEKVLAEHADFLKARKSVQLPAGGHQRRDFLWLMHFFNDSFAKGRTPFTTISTAHGYYLNHSPLYSLPPTPLRGRYLGTESPKPKQLDDAEFWDYPVEQPFKIANRKGILTHPAWLIAFSPKCRDRPGAARPVDSREAARRPRARRADHRGRADSRGPAQDAAPAARSRSPTSRNAGSAIST